MEVIASTQNSLIKLAASLKQKKYRDENGVFPVEGVRLVEEAIQAGWEITACLVTKKALDQARVQTIIQQLQERHCRLTELSEGLYAKVTDTDQAQGIMAIVKKKEFLFADLVAGERQPLIAVLDNVQDPGNVGALIRTADAAGCTAVILTQGSADLFSPKTVRATMGSIFHLPVVTRVSPSELLHYLQQYHIQLIATALTAAKPYFEVELTGPAAIVFGNEGNGVSDELLQHAASRLFIPLYGRAESLNVAAAAAVIFYEIARQQRAAL